MDDNGAARSKTPSHNSLAPPTMSSTSPRLALSLLLLLLAAAAATAAVPRAKQFRYVNAGQVSDYYSEYFTDFIPLDVFTFPFRLCFYNATPDAHYLALRMGFHRGSPTVFRWIWEANRGHPVHTNATVTFAADGNLVLADADGTIAWQTGTANKGVVDLRLLPNGNLVLVDKRGRYVWQSFDHPTDSLLVGQSLRIGGPTTLTARTAERDASNGPYSLVLEPKRLALYLKAAAAASGKSMVYFDSSKVMRRVNDDETLTSVSLERGPWEDYPPGSILYLHFFSKYPSGPSDNLYTMAKAKFNTTQSFLRLDLDGNLRIYTFIYGTDIDSWETPFVLFSRGGLIDECGLPSRCGTLGVCETSQCVACPQPRGLLGWTSSCKAPPLPPCGRRAISYYKVAGVEHFSSSYEEGQGPMTEAACRDRCTEDCACRGFFYRGESSRCLTVPLLGTITKVDNSSHVAYIKK